MTLTRRRFLRDGLLRVVGGGLAFGGCRPVGRPPASAAIAWGRPGLRDGDFQRPRAVNAHRGEVYVIDTTGRVQVFSSEGVYQRQWSTPASER